VQMNLDHTGRVTSRQPTLLDAETPVSGRRGVAPCACRRQIRSPRRCTSQNPL
jgi:hypothetical protein